MNKIEHIGIAVTNLQSAEQLYTRLLGTGPYKRETVESQGVITSFFKVGETKIELLEATGPESPVAKFLEKKGEGIHHVAYDVTDIVEAMARMQAEGFILINQTPTLGADNKLVCFLHPKTTGGVLIELCQERKELE
jgi:methylmalonyl-CoA/ethylmalonyl-CoA epimerase